MKNFLIFIYLLAISNFANSQSWSIVNSGTTNWLNGCSFGNSSVVYITGIGPTLLKSTNGGTSFYSISTSFVPSNDDISVCCFTTPDTGYVGGGYFQSFPTGGFVYKTTDGGVTWTSVLSGLSCAINAINFPSYKTGYAIGGEASSGYIYKSTDYGLTWNQIYNSGLVANMLLSGYFFDDTTGYVAGNDEGSFFAKIIAINNGAVFYNINFHAYTAYTDIYFKTIDTGFATAFNGSTGYILKTTDSALTWSLVYTGQSLNSIAFKTNMIGYAVGVNGTIVKTTDGGNNWYSDASPSTNNLRFITFANPGLGLIVGENGTILRYSEVATNASDIASQCQNITVFPNPSKEILNIYGAKANSEISIINTLGKKILTEKICTSGHFQINISDFDNGLYFIKIKESGESTAFNTKFVKL
jgi:hypothetical protein